MRRGVYKEPIARTDSKTSEKGFWLDIAVVCNISLSNIGGFEVLLITAWLVVVF